MRNRLRLQHFHILEAGLVGIFFVQATRLLIGLVYSRLASASLVSVLDPAAIDPGLAGVVDPATISGELSFLVYMLALPLLTIPLGRVRWVLSLGAALAAVGRVLMVTDTNITTLVSAAIVIGGTLVYIAMLIRYRAQVLPYLFIIGFGADQVFRAIGNTLDPSWSPDYFGIQLILTLVTILLGFFTVLWDQRQTTDTSVSPDRGLMPIWGGIGLGALLFLELSLLALPNAVAGRARTDYTTFVPPLLVATLLPLVPWVRVQVRTFISTFDGSVRGWLWMLLAALLVVFGTRFQGIVAGFALVIAQFMISMLWWWLTRPQAERERNVSSLWLIVSMVILGVLVIGDSFTYEYAFVRPLATGFTGLDDLLSSLLRGFRGMGLGLILLAVFLGTLPMTQIRRRVPWTGGTLTQTIAGILLIIAVTVGAANASRPLVVEFVRDRPEDATRRLENLRLSSYNIHSGFNEFFHFDMEAIARTIEFSGTNVVLLQEVDKGRLSSFGVDQSLWLARRLQRMNMDTRFYPTNEGLQGLAVLSNVEIVFDEGRLLSSSGMQTGLQRVQIRPDAGIINIYNTWLGLLLETDTDTETQEQDQQRQLNDIFAVIAGDSPGGNLGRIVVGGTFNNVPTSPLIQQMRDVGFSDPFDGQPREISYTLWRTGQRARVDYLWIRPPLQKLSAGVMETSASDHRMLVVETQIIQTSN